MEYLSHTPLHYEHMPVYICLHIFELLTIATMERGGAKKLIIGSS